MVGIQPLVLRGVDVECGNLFQDANYQDDITMEEVARNESMYFLLNNGDFPASQSC